MSKQSKRRKLAKLRACLFDGKPMSIMPSAIPSILGEIETATSIDSIESSLSFGREVESITKFINGVAIIPVTGVLRDEADWMVRFGYASSYQLIERDFKQAVSNPQVKGVLFYFDTPGGSAIGCKRVADLIFSSRGEKPIRGYVQGVCGSAGFYMAMACDRIEATADSLVGSVGTIYNHEEISGALKEFGIGVTVFTNAESPKKGHGNRSEPLTDASKKTLQDFTDSYGRSFIEDVARYRGITAEQVVENYGQGDAMRADIAIDRGMIDAVVESFSETLESISGVSSETPIDETDDDETPVVAGTFFAKEFDMKVSKKIRAQLFALDLIDSPDVSDEICNAALTGWFGSLKQSVPSDELAVLNGLREVKAGDDGDGDGDGDGSDGGSDGDGDDDGGASDKAQTAPGSNANAARNEEQHQARLADIRASADLVNSTLGYQAVTADMVLDAVQSNDPVSKVAADWNKEISKGEPPVPTSRVRVAGEGADRFAADAIDAMVYRSSDNPDMELSDNAAALVNRPLWAIAGECLQLAGQQVDMYGDRELISEHAMQMGNATRRHTFFSGNEDRRYIQAAGGVPNARPGDFPNILSGLANKFLDTIQLDDDYSYPAVSALLPGGLNDFKPGLMINKGIVEELDEVQDAEKFKELGVAEEVLSYIFLRRFGNSFGWTPVLVANDDMNAFAEGMLGLAEAWQVTQNRLVVDRFTTTETLLDGSALFADRADTGVGTNPAANNNIAATGGAPSDATWASCELAYTDIGGIGTGRRVRGTLNTWFGPTGTQHQEAKRTFMPLNAGGLEPKQAAMTANVGIYRNTVNIIAESELRVSDTNIWYALRNPTRLNTATVVRAYFNGFGTAGRRERWYDPTNKTTWVSLEGRIAVATKNWRYTVRNPGA